MRLGGGLRAACGLKWPRDLDFCKIFINRGKGAKDRYILFPASFRLVLKSHLRASRHMSLESVAQAYQEAVRLVDI
jgi:hypothetical protein